MTFQTIPASISKAINNFSSLLITKSNIISLWICSIYFCFWTLITNLLYTNFSTGGWDLALFSQLTWALSKGTQETSLFDGHFLTEHTFFIAYPISLIYKIFSHPLTLQYIKLSCFIWSAFILYNIARKKLNEVYGLSLLIIYLFFPANIGMLLGTFNFEPLAMPFIFLMIKFYEENNYKRFLTICLIICLIKENLPLIVIMFGLYAFITRKADRFRWGIIPLVSGTIFFITLNFILIPYLRREMPVVENIFWDRYKHLGNTPLEILSSLATNPALVASTIFTKANITYLAKLFGPEGIFTIFSPLTFLIGLPLLMKNLLSSNPLEKDILLYYNSCITCIIFLGYIRTFEKFSSFKRKIFYLIFVVLTLIHTCSFYRLWEYQFIKKPSISKMSYIRNFMVSRIPPSAGVISSNRTLPQLSQRDILYRFDFYLWGRHKNSRRHFKIPTNVEYALFDIPKNPTELEAKKIRRLLLDPSWQTLYFIHNTILLKRSSTHEPNDIFILKEEKTSSLLKSAFPINNKLELINISLTPHPSLRKPLLFVKTSLRKTAGFSSKIYVNLNLFKKDDLIYTNTRLFGYNLYSSTSWSLKTTLTEQYAYWLPKTTPGPHKIIITLIEEYGSIRNKFILYKEKFVID